MRDTNYQRIAYAEVVTPDGPLTFPRATVDCFEIGELTVSRLSDNAELWVFPKGTWSAATAFDANHYPMFSIELQARPIRVVTLLEARTA